MSPSITIRVREPTAQGRLYPQYDAESDILTIGSMVQRPWPQGVDIDGNIVFDLDENRLLANLDLHVGKRLWHKGIKRPWPSNADPHDLEFTMATIGTKSFSTPLRINTDRQRSQVEIEIGENDEGKHETAIALSDRCVAFVCNDQLVAILARL